MDYIITIGIPVYDAEQYIQRTLDSALAQTFVDIEFLLVDDCCTDGTIDIVKQYQQSHPRGKDIYILTQPNNMGVSAARNRIIDEAKGKYLYFMDSDDLISVNCISLLYENIVKYDAEIAVGSYEKIYGEDRELNQYPLSHIKGEDAMAEHTYYKNKGGFQTSVCNILYDLGFLRRIGLKMVNSRFWEDFVFVFDLVTYVRSAVLLPDITYHYLCRDNSLSNYQERDSISKQEVLNNISMITRLKNNSLLILDKKYIGERFYNLFKMDYNIICNILKNRQKIYPSFSDYELQMVLALPMSASAILRFRNKRCFLLIVKILSKCPMIIFKMFLLLIKVVKVLK